MDKAKIKEYFLENLSPKEVENLELKIITEADFAVEMDVVETELMEDYLDNSLSVAEKKRFETNFLVTDERQKRLDFLQSIKHFAKTAATKFDERETPTSFFDSIKAFFSPRQIALGFGAIILLLALGISWRIFSPVNNANPEIAAMNQRDLSNLDEFKNLTNLSLMAGTLRSGGDTQTLDSKNLADKILFQLALPANTPLNSTYQVNLLQDKNSILTLNKVRIYKNDAGQEFRMILPATLLKKGDYQIELQAENSNESKIIYNFAVR